MPSLRMASSSPQLLPSVATSTSKQAGGIQQHRPRSLESRAGLEPVERVERQQSRSTVSMFDSNQPANDKWRQRTASASWKPAAAKHSKNVRMASEPELLSNCTPKGMHREIDHLSQLADNAEDTSPVRWHLHGSANQLSNSSLKHGSRPARSRSSSPSKHVNGLRQAQSPDDPTAATHTATHIAGFSHLPSTRWPGEFVVRDLQLQKLLYTPGLSGITPQQ